MSQPEYRLAAQIMRMCRNDYGAWCMKVHGSEHQMSGVPDIIGSYRGLFFGIEVKMPGNKPSKIQEYRMAEMEKAGVYVTWVNSLKDARYFMNVLKILMEKRSVK